EQGGLVGIGAGERPGRDHVDGVAERAGEREQGGRMKPAEARARHDQHADEAGADRRPAPPAHPLAQHRSRQHRHEKRRREDDRQRLVELEPSQREDVEDGRDQQQGRAPDLQQRSPRRHDARAGDWVRHHEREQEGAGVARPHHLERVHVAVEIFGRGVETGEARDGARHQRDAGKPLALLVRFGQASGVSQYVARPPEMSNTAPVVNEQSAEAQKAASAAISSTSTNRPRGIFDSMKSMCSWVIWSKIAVLAAAGVMAFTAMSLSASSLPSDLVSAISAAFEAEYAGALGLPSLPAIEAMLTMRP